MEYRFGEPFKLLTEKATVIHKLIYPGEASSQEVTILGTQSGWAIMCLAIQQLLSSLIYMCIFSQKILLQKPFSHLVGSSDDAVVTLKLEFLSNQPGKHEVQVT